MAEQPTATAPWHQALAYAVTGRRHPGLGEQTSPEVADLASMLQSAAGPDGLTEHVRATLQAGEPWPHPVPAEVMDGLGYAQFAAALAQLRAELRLGPDAGARPRVGARQPLTAAERRLLEEVPPHHGS